MRSARLGLLFLLFGEEDGIYNSSCYASQLTSESSRPQQTSCLARIHGEDFQEERKAPLLHGIPYEEWLSLQISPGALRMNSPGNGGDRR